jgi:glycosyltransferase involved in cell wall biosynthesis
LDFLEVGTKKKIILSINTVWNVVNFRETLIKFLQNKNYEVIVLAQSDEYAKELALLDVRLISISINSQKLSIINDLKLLMMYIWYFYKIQPDIYLGYTIKPNLYGSIAAKIFNTPVVNNINGLGKAFSTHGLLFRFARYAYKFALSKSKTIFFQNQEDKDFFISLGIAHHLNAGLLPGSGVDLDAFNEDLYSKQPEQPFTFILIARLLKEKGIFEYIHAARLTLKDYPGTKFLLMGIIDENNPSSLTINQIYDWQEEGVIKFLGVQDDVRPFLAQSDCVVLPSYYNEGTPKCLLEAASMSKPIITTDWKGCKDTVDHGINGLLCKPKDVQDLYLCLNKMVGMSELDIQKLKSSSRKKAKMFDEKIVFNEYLKAIEANI